VFITDRGSTRYVHIQGFHRVALGKPAWESTFETFYSKEFLEKILGTKKDWLKCELDRSELPEYLEQPFRRHFHRFGVDLQNKTILDFGCGAGASSVILCRLGGKRIIGVDCSKDELEIAQLRARDCGLTDRLDFLYLPKTQHLPFKSGSFWSDSLQWCY
jgi:2-polyprenyl-3-methyl-5-hydroxy-6-metoxy-1,4-benzoquinol methylase